MIGVLKVRMGMTQRMVLGVLGLLAAALIPMTVSRFGVSLFWSQALGIVGGSLLMFMALHSRASRRRRESLFLGS
jgi:hypothetical protein